MVPVELVGALGTQTEFAAVPPNISVISGGLSSTSIIEVLPFSPKTSRFWIGLLKMFSLPVLEFD